MNQLTHGDPHRRPLHRMFTSVPKNYDLMNRLLTWRMDERWRKKAAKICLENNPSRVLDLCTGTGDLVLHMAKYSKAHSPELHALDFSEPMLAIAGKKAGKKNIPTVHFRLGDVAEMPYESNYFDAVGIGFAFRNLSFRNPKTEIYLSEIVRIIKPGGRFVVVETSQPENRLIRFLYHLYLKWVVAGPGGLISGHPGAYRYLAWSAGNFYRAQEVSALLRKSGFSEVRHKSLAGGMACIHTAIK